MYSFFQADDDHDSGTESDDEFQNGNDITDELCSGKFLMLNTKTDIRNEFLLIILIKYDKKLFVIKNQLEKFLPKVNNKG